mgnify:CR=1 FL=1
MRVGSTLYWLLTDHLGSTAITANSSGSKYAELRYKAWGEMRYTYGTTPTAYKFTGQRLDNSVGLYYYGARYYDPALGRFVQADTLVPEPGNPQALNRYAYVNNNPVRYTDPTGMYLCEDAYGDCDPATAWAIETIIQVETKYGVSVAGDWSRAEARVLKLAFQRMERGVAHQLGIPAGQARSILATTFAGGTITRGSNADPLHAYGVLALFLLTGNPGGPMGSTFAPYYTIGASGSLTFPGLAGPTAFVWDKAFTFGTNEAIKAIIHESGHLLDYLVSPGTPDLVTGSAASQPVVVPSGRLQGRSQRLCQGISPRAFCRNLGRVYRGCP